ncbi:MAG: type toxin-antitoxin system Phd/YefM family antitoxin [Rhizobium sp.]|nr:type toxin-antitoxin system Phd/YefM family antitoxin [Rhizobium sp.]
MTMMSSREFNQDRSKAKKLADDGPVIITDRGKPSHVLMTYDEYLQLAKHRKSIAELISMDADDDIDFDPPKLEDDREFKPMEFD